MTGLKFYLLGILALSASYKMMAEQQSDVNVGNITELNGVGRVVRDETFNAALSLDINSFDTVSYTHLTLPTKRIV